jgi:hypothetical protein
MVGMMEIIAAEGTIAGGWISCFRSSHHRHTVAAREEIPMMERAGNSSVALLVAMMMHYHFATDDDGAIGMDSTSMACFHGHGRSLLYSLCRMNQFPAKTTATRK